MSYHDRPVSCPVLSSYLIVTPHRTHDSPDIYDIIFSGKLLFFFDIVKHFMIFVSYQLHNILKSPSTLSLSLLPCVTNIFFLRPLLLHSILCSIEVTMSIPISLSLSLSLSLFLALYLSLFFPLPAFCSHPNVSYYFILFVARYFAYQPLY